MVTRAAAPAEEENSALEQLCRAYWFPVYAYARKQGCSASDAEDVTQDFFAEIMQSQFLQRADRAQGRFRSYLLGSVRNRIINAHERAKALKRGGAFDFVSIDEPTAEEQFRDINDPALDPAQAYELSWALTVLQRARGRVIEEQKAKGRLLEFEKLEPFLSAPPSDGEYAEIAQQLGISRNHVAVSIHRLGRRYRDLLREEVAQTVSEPSEIEEELAYLLKVLAR
jgi:RNA polymerase sigma-70 factor (ECF subfamily)